MSANVGYQRFVAASGGYEHVRLAKQRAKPAEYYIMQYKSNAPSEVSVNTTSRRFSLTSFPPLPQAAEASRMHVAGCAQGALAPAQRPMAIAPTMAPQHGYRLRTCNDQWVSASTLARALTPRSAAMRHLQSTLLDNRIVRAGLAAAGLAPATPAVEKLRQLSTPSLPPSPTDSAFDFGDAHGSAPSPVSSPSHFSLRLFARQTRPELPRGAPYVQLMRFEHELD